MTIRPAIIVIEVKGSEGDDILSLKPSNKSSIAFEPAVVRATGTPGDQHRLTVTTKNSVVEQDSVVNERGYSEFTFLFRQAGVPHTFVVSTEQATSEPVIIEIGRIPGP